MQFTQPAFILFAALFFAGWRLLRRGSSIQLAYLVTASFIFYSFGDWRPLLVLVFISLLGYLGGLGIARQPRYKRLILGAAVALMLGVLLALKYSTFLLANTNTALAWLNLQPLDVPTLTCLSRMPTLGVSFYILQSIAYLVDVSRGRIQPERRVLPYFAYIAMFPKLIAGPIERGKSLLTQLAAGPISPTEKQIWEGTQLIVFGCFSKMVIADNLAPFVDSAFISLKVTPSPLYWWVMVTAFAFQLYCDFSGYSAIAVGLGKWMGYDLTVNFNHPYTARSLADFWGRWHISLSAWLRDYIFFPLNRSKWGRHLSYLNAVVTFLISGLWHGAAWHYILWGGLHGLFICLERLTGWSARLKRLRLGGAAAWLLVLLQVWVGWVFFRAASIPQGFQILRAMFTFVGGQSTSIDPACIFYLLLGALPELAYFLQLSLRRWLPVRLAAGLEVVFICLLVVAAVLLRGPGSQFIYFQF